MQTELEENKRSVDEMNKARNQLSAEVAKLKDRLESEKDAKSAEQASRRRLQEQLQELQISTSANGAMHGGMLLISSSSDR
jgi:hypothetical protein